MLYLILHSHKGCMQEPEIVLGFDAAREKAIQTLTEDGDIEGSDVAVYELNTSTTSGKIVCRPSEIAEAALERASEAQPKATVETVDLDTGAVTFQRGEWRLTFEWIGEGVEGDYDADDPEDEKRLRADLSFGAASMVDDESHVDSYCTLATVGTPVEILSKMADTLFNRLSMTSKLGAKHQMAAWTWLTSPSNEMYR